MAGALSCRRGGVSNKVPFASTCGKPTFPACICLSRPFPKGPGRGQAGRRREKGFFRRAGAPPGLPAAEATAFSKGVPENLPTRCPRVFLSYQLYGGGVEGVSPPRKSHFSGLYLPFSALSEGSRPRSGRSKAGEGLFPEGWSPSGPPRSRSNGIFQAHSKLPPDNSPATQGGLLSALSAYGWV